MKRNPLLFIVFCLIVVGALFFRYIAPERSTRLIEVAAHVQKSAVEAVTAAVASVTATQEKKETASLEAEDARLMAEQQKLARIIENDVAEAASSKDDNEEPTVPDSGEKSATQNVEIDRAMERANALLKNATEAAKAAREQIAIAQKELDSLNQARARLNVEALQLKSTAKSAASKVTTQKPSSEIVGEKKDGEKAKTEIKVVQPHAPASEIERLLADSTIRFDWVKSALNDDAVMKINQVTEVMKKNPDISLRIIGHTDANGKEELNSWLGLIRARRVRQQLIARGIDAKRIAVSSRGSLDPIESNDSPMGRWKNRRVEFALSEK